MNSSLSLQQLEEQTIQYWKDNHIFQKSITQKPESEQFTFVDGPPFVTGSPHYGSLLPSIAKDVIPRYQTMLGKRVRRVFGWDCHGLPIEEKVSKELRVKSNKDIDDRIGIPAYIAACRNYVNSCSDNWRWYIERIGRWVDMDNAYYTMSPEFMESVIWAFKQIYNKGLIYKGKRVSLYSTDTSTPVSQFEVAMDPDNYRDIDDLSIFTKFELSQTSVEKLKSKAPKIEGNVYLVAWTTTPWTIPANMALAVNQKVEYLLVNYENQNLIVAKPRLQYTFNIDEGQIGEEEGQIVRILATFTGNELEGLDYLPVYDYFVSVKTANDFKVYLSDDVTIEDGTGVLHIAPAFGEVDFNLGKKHNLSATPDIDDMGNMTVGEWKGIYLRDASPLVAEDLQQRGNLLRSEVYRHRLPFYRGANPLIYMAQDAYFIDIQKIKQRMQEINQDINWIPEHIKEGRFLHTINTSPDWCISRNRYWATIMPVWVSVDGEELVMGSIEEMLEYTDQIIKNEDGKYLFVPTENGQLKTENALPMDLHRDICDQIILKKDGKEFKRIPEVLDCWMDSGSAPFAEHHYPFENKTTFESSQPADFIIEYVGQIRAWFNVLLRLSTMVFDKGAFTNVICTGVLAGTDGRKMSKSFGNYPDPKATIEKYGADALRLYFMSSPVMLGEDMNFNEQDLSDQLKSILNILWNSFKYYDMYASAQSLKNDPTIGLSDEPWIISEKDTKLDQWIKLRLKQTAHTIASSLNEYNIPVATRAIRPFVDDLSTWYIRRNRDRFTSGDAHALETLYTVLLGFSRVAAPIIPFITEQIYRGLTQKESVHLENYPYVESLSDQEQVAIEQMELTRRIASLGQAARLKAGIKIKQPLSKLYLKLPEEFELDDSYTYIITDELNVKALEVTTKFDEAFDLHEDKNIQVALNTNLTEELIVEGKMRDLTRAIQEFRKTKGLQVSDEITLKWFSDNEIVIKAMNTYAQEIKASIKAKIVTKANSADGLETLEKENIFLVIN